jgi:glycosyltransferase involved in cell wall biosynthesis
MVVLEAMTCGIPVVSTSFPGSSEIITHGINGLLVPVADEQSLVEATMKLLTDLSLAKKLAQSGKNRVNDFSIEKVIKEYEELLKAAVK